jgi:hypothetical protein
VSGGGQEPQSAREERIRAVVDKLVGTGGSVQEQVPGSTGLDHVVMTDPEGNEFCVV